jgi:predicted alpha/beta-fold hydrolase
MISLLLGLVLGAMSALAAPRLDSQTCAVRRGVGFCAAGQVCEASAREDFDGYIKSNLNCGVYKEALPFIADAKGPNVKGTVVLVHGLSANPAHVRHIADQLTKEGYNVVAPILHGHGGTDEAMARGTLDEWKADVKFAGSVGAQMKGPLYIMGHSTGGVMASRSVQSFYRHGSSDEHRWAERLETSASLSSEKLLDLSDGRSGVDHRRKIRLS